MSVPLPHIVVLSLVQVGLYVDILGVRSRLDWRTSHIDIAMLSVETQIWKKQYQKMKIKC